MSSSPIHLIFFTLYTLQHVACLLSYSWRASPPPSSSTCLTNHVLVTENVVHNADSKLTRFPPQVQTDKWLTNFSAGQIRDMELTVLGALDWRPMSATAPDFLDRLLAVADVGRHGIAITDTVRTSAICTIVDALLGEMCLKLKSTSDLTLQNLLLILTARNNRLLLITSVTSSTDALHTLVGLSTWCCR